MVAKKKVFHQWEGKQDLTDIWLREKSLVRSTGGGRDICSLKGHFFSHWLLPFAPFFLRTREFVIRLSIIFGLWYVHIICYLNLGTNLSPYIVFCHQGWLWIYGHSILASWVPELQTWKVNNLSAVFCLTQQNTHCFAYVFIIPFKLNLF